MSDARIKILKNGTQYDLDKHRFISGPSEEFRIQSGDHARALALKRNALAREKAREGALRAALEACPDDIEEDADAWRAIVRARALDALADKGRVSVEAARFVGHVTGWAREHEDGEHDDRARVLAPADVEALMALARAIDDEVRARTTRALALDADVCDT
jgi:prophage DNA circulation protein